MNRTQFAMAFAGTALLMGAGCLSKPVGHEANTEAVKEQEIPLPQKVNAAGVTTNVYGPMPRRELYYSVRTDLVTANLGTNQLLSGVTGKVTGTIYSHGTAQFSADSAKASHSTPKSEDLDVLTLFGHVAVHSQKPVGNLYCDQLSVELKTHILKAVGHVRFNTAKGLVGTLPEAWATQDLATIATPTLFHEMQ